MLDVKKKYEKKKEQLDRSNKTYSTKNCGKTVTMQRWYIWRLDKSI